MLCSLSGDDIRMKKQLRQYLIIFAGLVLTAYAISACYLPNKIVSGGVSGISTILYHMFKIPPGLSFALINAALLAVALFFLGKGFVIKTLAGASLLSLLVQLFSYLPPLTENIFLATIFGAFLYGIGIGLTLVVGASTGGTDVLSRLLQCAFPHMKIGRLLLVTDLAVILASLIAFKNIDLTLWGIVALSISTFSVDWLIGKLNISKLAFIVTDKGIEISKFLVSTSPRGVTIIDAVGAYTMEGKSVLMCALKENELPEFQKKILQLDPSAFLIFSESQQIVGNGFHVYR